MFVELLLSQHSNTCDKFKFKFPMYTSALSLKDARSDIAITLQG
jgi:hypothetical protein